MEMKGDKELTICENEFSPGYREVFLRLMATLTTLGAAIVMGLDNQTIDIYGVYIHAKYYYMPAITFFVVANATAAVYGLLSPCIYYTSNVKGHLHSTRKWLFFFDLMTTLVITSGISAASAIGYIGLKGNNHVGWMEICSEFGLFCHRAEGALSVSAMGLFIFVGLTILSAVSMSTLRKFSAEDGTMKIEV